jgi:hypothetical protein
MNLNVFIITVLIEVIRITPESFLKGEFLDLNNKSKDRFLS